MELGERKKEQRRQFLAKRDALPPGERREKSGRIWKQILELEAYKRAEAVFCYVSYRSEVETAELLENMLKDKKRVYVPLVDGREMEFWRIRSLGELTSGAFGILEPDVNKCTGEKDVPEWALMLMPGSAFDLDGNRLGYGGGYYDRYLRRHPHCIKVGLAYEIQISEKPLLQEVSDIRVDTLVTEKGVYRCK